MALSSDLTQIGITPKQADFLGDTQSASITLTGTNQATGVAITSNINRISGGTIVTAIAAVLPLIRNHKGSMIVIRSDFIGFAAQIFPAVGEKINGLAANTAFSLAAGTGVILFKLSSDTWIALGSAT